MYSSGSRRIFVNIPRVRALLERAEARRTDPIPQAEAVLAHELTHVLQHQYAGGGGGGGESEARLMLREGHGTWVAEQALSGAAREQARLEGGVHRLSDPAVSAEERPYVFGHAAGAPGATAPDAAAALSVLGSVPSVPPTEVSAEWAVLAVEAGVRGGSTCAAATATWRPRVVPAEAGLLDRFEAAGCRFN